LRNNPFASQVAPSPSAARAAPSTKVNEMITAAARCIAKQYFLPHAPLYLFNDSLGMDFARERHMQRARLLPIPSFRSSCYTRDEKMAEEGLQLFGGNWTERKLDALEQYLRAYAKALSKTNFKRVYIDAFAGTGYREQRVSAVEVLPSIFEDDLKELAALEPQRFLDGSAKIALRVDPAFHNFIFVEYDDAKVRELEKLKTEFPAHASSIDVRAGDANATIRDLCKTWDKRGTRGVLFLDPFGMQAQWSTIEAIAATGSIDTWILFPFAANRLMTKLPTDIPAAWRDRLDMLFGTKDWEKQFYKEKTLVDIFHGDMTVIEKNLTLQGLGAYYNERLRSTFPKVAPNPRILRSSGNVPLFLLCFAAANAGKGGDIALKIAKHILDKI
jgi:three-Cys-motif partner protein